MLHQGQLSSGLLCETSSCSAKPKESTVYLPQEFCEHALHAYRNSHIRRDREEEIFEREKGNSLLHSKTLFSISAFPATAVIERWSHLRQAWVCHTCFQMVQKSSIAFQAI